MPCSHGDLGLGAPASFLAPGSSDQSLQHQRVHIGGLEASGGLLSGGDQRADVCSLEGICSLEGTLAQLDSVRFANIVISRGIVGGVLHMLNQNRHYWTPPKWFSSSAVSPSDAHQQPTNDLTSPSVYIWGARPQCRMSLGWMSLGCGQR